LLYQPETKKLKTEDGIMARPKQKKELKRSHKVTIIYTENKYAGIEANVKEMEVTVSSFIRTKSLRGYVRVPKYAVINIHNPLPMCRPTPPMAASTH
jgi:hypothetical protein